MLESIYLVECWVYTRCQRDTIAKEVVFPLPSLSSPWPYLCLLVLSHWWWLLFLHWNLVKYQKGVCVACWNLPQWCNLNLPQWCNYPVEVWTGMGATYDYLWFKYTCTLLVKGYAVTAFTIESFTKVSMQAEVHICGLALISKKNHFRAPFQLIQRYMTVQAMQWGVAGLINDGGLKC